MKLQIYQILKNTKAEGPNTRYCIWFQGCKKHCKGCFAKATWRLDGGIEKETNDVIKDILNTKNIEGVTFLGGEPFLQFDALYEISKAVYNAGLSTLCFTGYSFNYIKKNYSKIFPYTDLLITGRFDETKKDYKRPWVGSSNQEYHFLTSRYNEGILDEYRNKIEINIKKNGTIFINGMGDFEALEKNLKMFTVH